MRLSLTVLMLFFLLPLQAQNSSNNQQTTKQAFVFKFTPGDDIFYDNIFENGEELQQLSSLIESNLTGIESGAIKIIVEGYCASGTDSESNRLMAVTRSNRVKSRLIESLRIKEDYFRTTNRTVAYEGQTDVDVISLSTSGSSVASQSVPATVKPAAVTAPQTQTQTHTSNQQTKENTFVFKFTPGDDIFHVNIFRNRGELQQLSDLIQLYRSEIESGAIKLIVEGYSASAADSESNRQMAMVRSNRVKSRLIEDLGVKEDYFNTTNRPVSYDGEKDVTLVILNVPEKEESVQIPVMDKPEPVIEEQRKEDVTAVVEAPKTITERQEPVVETPRPVIEEPKREEPLQPVVAEQPKQQPVVQNEVTVDRQGIFSLRANLLYRLGNMVNLGAEWNPSDDWGILLNAGWSGTEWKNGDRKLRLWMVSPEIRWYLDANNRWFLGVQGLVGKFNIKLSDTGYQGNYMGGGLTGGYRLVLSRYFDMDFSLGLGYIYTDYDEYYRENGESVKKNETRIKKNILGPTQAGVSLIWKLK